MARLPFAIKRALDEAKGKETQKLAEEALRKSEELFRNLFQYHAAVKLIIDPDTGSIIDANEAAVNYYGWPYEQIIRMKIQDFNTLPPEEVKAAMDGVRNQNKFHFEFRHRRADGSVRDVEIFSSNIKVQGKDILHSIVHDITERKHAEETIRKLNDNLEQRVKERTADLNEKVVELKELNRVFIDRELKMIELKTRIAELETKMITAIQKQDYGDSKIGLRRLIISVIVFQSPKSRNSYDLSRFDIESGTSCGSECRLWFYRQTLAEERALRRFAARRSLRLRGRHRHAPAAWSLDPD